MIEKYYKILDIPSGSDEETIKKAYRKLALKIHPDVNKAPDAVQKFQEICEAYEILLAHHMRTTYFNPVTQPIHREEGYSWEEIIREANEKARQRTKIRYEKLKAEQELFEKTIWKDIIIVLKYTGSVAGFMLALWMISWPVYIALTTGLSNLFALVFFFTVGILLLIHILKDPRSWFVHGKPDLHLSGITGYFNFSQYAGVNTECAYCKGLKGRGRPFRFTMLKVRDIQIRNEGVARHYAHYKRNYKDLVIPRSRKAFIIHFIITWIKIITLVSGLFYFPSPSIIWRLTFSCFIAGILSGIILSITRTRSKVSFLLTPFNIIKVSIWISVLLTQSHVYPGFIIDLSEQVFIYIMLMILFLDMLLDLILRLMPSYPRIYHPIPGQLPGVEYLFKKGYQTYLDVPVWSTIYPFFRWLI